VAVVGLVADVDFESEKFRWMGALRLDVYVGDSRTLSKHFHLLNFFFSHWFCGFAFLQRSWMIPFTRLPLNVNFFELMTSDRIDDCSFFNVAWFFHGL
jgi:hypothetical protein